MKILISAIACRPDRGSEGGIGWNTATEMAKYYEIWVLTHKSNESVIVSELKRNPVSRLHFIYFELPEWLVILRNLPYLRYYLWQYFVLETASKAHKEIQFNLGHHITLGKYSAPSFLANLPIPFIWGPVGGGESFPSGIKVGFGIRHNLYEFFRSSARWLGELDPAVRKTARKCLCAIATTKETAQRQKTIGASNIKVFQAVGLKQAEIEKLGKCGKKRNEKVIFLSMGRLHGWKGFVLGLRAFAKAKIKESEYWIIGEGPAKKNLNQESISLGISDQIRFLGRLSRTDALEKFWDVDILVHPSLHDSGGWVCLEALAAGKPIICLDLGGPSCLVNDSSGIKITPISQEQIVGEMAAAMKNLAANNKLCQKMGDAGKKRVASEFTWERKGKYYRKLYEQIRVN